MWKPEHRATADRRGLRYESDLTDAEWTLVAPLIRPAKRGGRPRMVNVREVLNAIFYVLWTGCQWNMRCRIIRHPVQTHASTDWTSPASRSSPRYGATFSAI